MLTVTVASRRAYGCGIPVDCIMQCIGGGATGQHESMHRATYCGPVVGVETRERKEPRVAESALAWARALTLTLTLTLTQQSQDPS